MTSVPVICSTAQQAVRFGTDLGGIWGQIYTPSGGLTGVQAIAGNGTRLDWKYQIERWKILEEGGRCKC